jgi:hypothetical protein
MRPILFAAAAMIGALSILASTDARAQNRWCARGTGADNCGFFSYQQCRANIAGIGGKCVPDARAAAAPEDRRVFDRPVRKKPR